MPIDTKLTYSFTTIDVPSSSSVSAAGIRQTGGNWLTPVASIRLRNSVPSASYFAMVISPPPALRIPAQAGFSRLISTILGSFWDTAVDTQSFTATGLSATCNWSSMPRPFRVQRSRPDRRAALIITQRGIVFYSNGTYTDVRVPGAFRILVADINDRGVIVGSYGDHPAPPYTHGFVDTGGTSRDC